MRGHGLVTAGGMLLAGVVAIGTWLYVLGAMPPFPWNGWAFNGLLWAALAYALLLGRAR